MAEMQRWLDLDGCDNFRDVGGYTTRDGRSTRWNVLYRSDALARLNTEGAGRLRRELDVRTIVDLRSDDEAARAPLATELADRRVSFAMDNPEIDAIREAGIEGMGHLYLWNLDVKQDAFARIVRLLADASNLPAVIQCSGGKDRTGITVALILDLLGVPDETIVEDYLLTDQVRARVPRRRYEDAVQRLVDAGLDPAILGARRETMTEFLDGFRRRWGSAEDYLVSADVGNDVIESLRRNLLERPAIS
jgi:protein-tyrosine phosphatase